jgi:hypothetical protein
VRSVASNVTVRPLFGMADIIAWRRKVCKVI